MDHLRDGPGVAGFTPPQFPGSQWVAPVLGASTIVVALNAQLLRGLDLRQ
jgi:hypothetical protein